MKSTFTMPSEREQPNGAHVPGARPDAPRDAAMELVIEGTAYPCKDGTLIGSGSEFAKEFFSRANGLESRHLLEIQVGASSGSS